MAAASGAIRTHGATVGLRLYTTTINDRRARPSSRIGISFGYCLFLQVFKKEIVVDFKINPICKYITDGRRDFASISTGRGSALNSSLTLMKHVYMVGVGGDLLLTKW